MIKYAELRKKRPSLKMPECGVNIWMNRSQWDDMLNTPIIIMPLHYYFKRVTLSRRPRSRPVCSDARTFRARFRSPHPRYESVWIVYTIIIINSAIIHSLAHSLARYAFSHAHLQWRGHARTFINRLCERNFKIEFSAPKNSAL